MSADWLSGVPGLALSVVLFDAQLCLLCLPAGGVQLVGPNLQLE